MDLIDENLGIYAQEHSSYPLENILEELERRTYIEVLQPQMLSGKLQGQFLSFISKMIQPSKILEIGTYTGYSALCLALGLKEGGVLHTIDINEELQPLVLEFIEKANFQDKIQTHIGKALDIIPTLGGNFDLVFIDADKLNYSNYYNMVLPLLKEDGLIIIDNVLWSGKILLEKMDKKTKSIDAFNKEVQNDNRVRNLLLPLRDGLMVVQKQG